MSKWDFPAFPSPSQSIPTEHCGLTKRELFTLVMMHALVSQGQRLLKDPMILAKQHVDNMIRQLDGSAEPAVKV